MGELTSLAQIPFAVLKGPTSKEREGKERGGKAWDRKVKGRERGEEVEEGFGPPKDFGVAPPMVCIVYISAYNVCCLYIGFHVLS